MFRLKNKKAQILVLRIMIGIIVFIIALALAPTTKDTIDISRNATNLNCTNPNLSSAQNATCIVTDMGIFWLIAVLIGGSIGIITGNRTPISIASSVFVFVLTIVLITPLKDFIITFRAAGSLNCGSAGLSTGAQLACLFVDVWLFWFIAVILATIVTIIFSKGVLPRLGFEDK